MHSHSFGRDELIQIGRDAITTERDGLELLSSSLNDAFAAAVEAILKTKGRVIVAGIGKSGHVGRKIAATLASTGTPALFVHPAEASHGDLGMLTPPDVAIVLSNSGETSELFPIIEHTRRFGIQLIGVASNPDSTLLQRADIALPLPKAPEACPIGRAPTTSTTMTMALGDALAVALMRARGFSDSEFRAFHPGGALGAKLLLASDLMHSGEHLPLVRVDAPLSDTILEMTQKTFGIAGVVDASGALIGVVTDGDLRRHLNCGAPGGALDARADDVATRSPKVIAPGILAAEALALMNDAKIHSVFVIDADRPIGLLRMHDCLRAGVR